jgi:hypothetical protein
MSYKKNLVIDQGTTFSANVTAKDASSNEIILDGYTANAQMRKWYSSSNSVTFSTSVSGNNVTLSLSVANTSAIEAGRYVYDVIVTDANNNKTRIVEGIATVTPKVTS